MLIKKRAFTALALLLLTFSIAAPSISAKPNEFDTIVRHLQSKYSAKKVHIPFMWLAKFGVKFIRPAGVKSFNITLFQDLKFSRETLDLEMQAAMRESFGPEWYSVFRIRSRSGEQAYMYMREEGKNVKVAVVTIDKEQAAVIRATFSPEKLAEFINNPRIMGISLSDKEDDKKDKDADKDKPKSDDPPTNK